MASFSCCGLVDGVLFTSESEVANPIGFEMRCKKRDTIHYGIIPALFNVTGYCTSLGWLYLAGVAAHPVMPFLATMGVIAAIFRAIIVLSSSKMASGTYNRERRIFLIRSATEIIGCGLPWILLDFFATCNDGC